MRAYSYTSIHTRARTHALSREYTHISLIFTLIYSRLCCGQELSPFFWGATGQTPTEDRSGISNIIHLLRALFVQAEDEYQNVCILHVIP